MEIILAKSLAGHDKNHIYVVYEEADERFLLLVNGTTRPIAKPKKKNKMHVQLIKKLPCEVQDVVNGMDSLDDDTIKKIVTLYNKYLDTCL